MPDSEIPSAAGTPRVLGTLALELTGLSPVGRDALARTEVDTLAGLIARDLGKLAPDAATLELVTVGAHYDPIELLRPAWPLPAELDQLAARAPRVLGALALELTGLSPVGRDALARTEVDTLAGLIARDLGKLAPDAATLELVTVGAHYDPIELLRPAWPLHAELDQLAARAPRSGIGAGEGRVIAFGSHEGKLPGALSPSAEHAGGPLRLVPFVLSGPEQATARVSAIFEADLLETGMASADTALAAQDAFGLQVEHARYMTVHDLLAMTAMQYDHA